MGGELLATVLPKLDEQDYLDVVDRANATTVATAAFNAKYWGDLGDDAEFSEQANERIGDRDPDVIDLIAARASAIEAIRTAARAGAQYVIERLKPFNGGTCTFHAAELGGPDVLVVGGLSFGDDPFTGFTGVAVLAAILAFVGNDPGRTAFEARESTS